MAGIGVVTHGSLFSGIGGFDLAAHWMGWDNVFNCEVDPFCRGVLRHYFPKAISYGDIKEADFRVHRGRIDILTGGFPCQPFSIAGKRLGKADERHLWPYMLRAVQQIRPRWVVAENVRGLLSWNEGLVFEEVHADLEAAGYEVQAFVLPAAGINAPHQRQRVWFIAHAVSIGGGARNGPEADPAGREAQKHGTGRQPLRDKDPAAGRARAAANAAELRCGPRGGNRQRGRVQADQWPPPQVQPQWQVGQRGPGATGPTIANPGGTGRQGPAAIGGAGRQETSSRPGTGLPPRHGWGKDWDDFPQAEPVICFGDDGLPAPLDLESIFKGTAAELTGISFPRWRTESIKALGNAIVPQIAYRIFKTTEAVMSL